MVSELRHHLALIGILSILFIGISSCDSTSEQDASSESRDIVLPVRTIEVQPTSVVETYTATGTYEPFEQVMITSELAGIVDKIYFREGEQISRGAPLLKVNTDRIKAQIRQETANLNNIQQQLQRARSLLEIEAISREEVDNLKFEVERIQALIDELNVVVDRSLIKSPFSGKTGMRQISPGSYLNIGDPIVEVVQQSPLKVTFSIPERYSNSVDEGDSVSIIESNNNIIGATINNLSPRVDPSTRSFQARSIIPNQELNILPGSFAEIELQVYASDSALIVPTESVIQKLGGEEIFVVENGIAKKRVIQTGVRKENYVEIVEGLQAGDQVIITGILSLSDGDKVQPTLAELSNLFE